MSGRQNCLILTGMAFEVRMEVRLKDAGENQPLQPQVDAQVAVKERERPSRRKRNEE